MTLGVYNATIKSVDEDKVERSVQLIREFPVGVRGMAVRLKFHLPSCPRNSQMAK